MLPTRRARSLLAALCTSLITIAAFTPASSGVEPKPGLNSVEVEEEFLYGDSPVVIERQNRLKELADSIRPQLEAIPGYAQLAVDAKSMSVTAYLAQGVADETKHELLESIPSDITLQFADAKFSKEEELDLHRYFAAIMPQLQKADIVLTSWGLDDPGTPFFVRFDRSRAELSAAEIAKISYSAPGLTAGNVATLLDAGDLVLEPGDPVVSAAGTRGDMGNPFWGGAAIHGPSSPNAVACSSGFAARSYSNSYYYLVTAEHCVHPTNKAYYTRWSTSGDLQIGSVSSANVGADAAFIRVSSSYASSPRVFTGALGTSTEQSEYKIVTGWESPDAGNIVCTSGYSLGRRCNVRVGVGTSLGMTNAYSGASSTTYGSGGRSTTDAAVSANGQSGGAVYRATSSTGMSAVGIVSAQSHSATCPSGARRTPCYSRVYFGLVWTLYENNNVYFAGWSVG